MQPSALENIVARRVKLIEIREKRLAVWERHSFATEPLLPVLARRVGPSVRYTAAPENGKVELATQIGAPVKWHVV